ncbi:MAG: glycoside hydrolase family 3 C-terminal domain-containing protein [Oscillospiraceae bacterium]|nr:glycoside hydrolase family 3 C-terminal domain-containing protein [Oscillospiraceae bacterium]
MEQKKRSVGQTVRLVLRTLVCAVLVVVLLAGIASVNAIVPTVDRMGNSILNGFDRKIDNSKANTAGLDLQYNKPDYTAQAIGAAEDDLAARIAAEGVVLLENRDNTLPMAQNTTFSLVSVNSTTVSAGGGMLGGGTKLDVLFQNAGAGINQTLWDFYTNGGGKGYGLASGSISFGDAEDFRINECPLSVMQGADGVLDSLNGTIPVYFLKRVAGEGRDMPRSMYGHADSAEDKARTYLEPDSTEREILKYLDENFDTVVLVLNSNAALELDWLADYPSIKAVIGAPDGLQALPGILTGAINPSGRTVDTFAADALASPAAQNFGDYLYFDESGNPTKYNYVSYAEGIYVGYKYYETRYEDAVMGTGNAGNFDYSKEVVYPFGHGLSYTAFDWSNFKASWSGDTCTVSVDVTNTGSTAGKDVVEVYVQSPYTDYDKQYGVEKPAVMLAGYAKTSELAPGASETVTVTFEKEQLKAYDSTHAKTYILDAGDYYITAAANAHDAVNNVLAAKGYTTADGMTNNGDASFVDTYTVSALDSNTYATDSFSGAPVSNLFDHARGDIAYLTRNDWIGTFPVHDGEPSNIVSTWGGEINGSDGVAYTWKKTASAALIAQLDSFDSNSPVDPASFSDTPVYGAKNGLTLIEMRGLDFDDPKWNDLLDQLTADDYYNTIGLSGYGIEAIDSVNKPFTIDADTAAGLIYGGTGKMFPNAMTLAQTWNQDLAREFGTMIGNEALLGGCNGWYAPSMNIHRTPFSGRNGEYYSEDAFLSGAVGSNATYGAASKGLYAYIKHFAFNDQENHRGDRPGQYSVATWLNEQSAREIYLKPFEMCMKVGDVELNYLESDGNGGYQNATRPFRASMGVMTAFNRVGATWTGGDYNLITGLLRNEWAFNGLIMTDNANTGVFMDGYQMIEAGADVKLTYAQESARFNFDAQNSAHYHYAREALHRTLYTIANTNAMNGAMPGSVFKEGMRLTDKAMLAVDIVFGLLAMWFAYVIFRGFKPSKRKLAKMERKQAQRAAKKQATG